MKGHRLCSFRCEHFCFGHPVLNSSWPHEGNFATVTKMQEMLHHTKHFCNGYEKFGTPFVLIFGTKSRNPKKRGVTKHEPLSGTSSWYPDWHGHSHRRRNSCIRLCSGIAFGRQRGWPRWVGSQCLRPSSLCRRSNTLEMDYTEENVEWSHCHKTVNWTSSHVHYFCISNA